MAITNFDDLKTAPKYKSINYLNTFRRLIPRGPIWGFARSLVSTFIQDVVHTGQANTIQDTIYSGQPETIQDTSSTTIESKSYTLSNLFSVISEEPARAEKKEWELLQEATPGLSVDLLEEWEFQAGLPGECGQSLPLTLEERQIQVHAKLYGEGQTVTVEYLVDYALLFGFTINIVEVSTNNSAWIVGTARMGKDRFGRKAAIDGSFIIEVLAGTGNLDQLKCIFEEIKPAHLIIVWDDQR